VKTKSVGSFLRIGARVASLAGIVCASVSFAAPPTDNAEALAREQWSETIANTSVPSAGCFMAEYPSTAWMPVGCERAPDVPFVPRTGAGSDTVGDEDDYAAGVTGTLTKTVGSFPVVTGVTSEKGTGGANSYSLQLNSNFIGDGYSPGTSAACDGYSQCIAWAQFIYSSDERAVFMQFWLINFNSYAECPAGWNTYSGSCYTNSNAVHAPKLSISDLSGMKVAATAVNGGNDTVIFTGGGLAYSVSALDSSYVDLAASGNWDQSEFNIIGDGGGSKARFNTGSAITVRVTTTDGSTTAPTCIANGGTTGETNNLILHACKASGGASPHIQFLERN
jgi:hypothetical protein